MLNLFGRDCFAAALNAPASHSIIIFPRWYVIYQQPNRKSLRRNVSICKQTRPMSQICTELRLCICAMILFVYVIYFCVWFDSRKRAKKDFLLHTVHTVERWLWPMHCCASFFFVSAIFLSLPKNNNSSRSLKCMLTTAATAYHRVARERFVKSKYLWCCLRLFTEKKWITVFFRRFIYTTEIQPWYAELRESRRDHHHRAKIYICSSFLKFNPRAHVLFSSTGRCIPQGEWIKSKQKTTIRIRTREKKCTTKV